MGWDSGPLAFGQTPTHYITERYTAGGGEVLDIAIVNRSEAYIAYRPPRRKYQRKPSPVIGAVTIFRIDRSRWLTAKDMSEDMGPFYYNAPQRILDKLDPPRGKDARAWRKQCRERLAWRAKVRATVKAGTTIRFDKPFQFSDGVERDTFTYEAGVKFRTPSGQLVRLNGAWRDMHFRVLRRKAS